MEERIIKEMEYSTEKHSERIAEGTYKGLDYYVLSFGIHPCAYIDITDTKLAKKGYNELDIDCHGGLTYGSKRLLTVDKTGYFIGWDYGHCWDYAGYDELFPPSMRSGGKKWTTSEIVAECRKVIDQIIEIEERYHGNRNKNHEKG